MMKRILAAAAASLVLAGGAPAADNLGVAIYPGARYDEQWSKLQAQVQQAAGGGKSACYRTRDSVANVAQFYQKEGFKLNAGSAMTEDGARLQKGASLSMTIRNMKTLDHTNGTRFCIAKQ